MQRIYRPLFVGIAGGSGSGKSTIARKIFQSLPKGIITIIEYDSYYRHYPEKNIQAREALNYDHPSALDTELLYEHLCLLRQMKSIDMPVYDFVHHLRKKESVHVTPTPIVIVEGMLAFVDKRIRSELDLKIFVDTDADLRILRRIQRDIKHRGRTFKQVRQQYYRNVRPMHLQYVEPSKRWANVIVPEGGENQMAIDIIVSKLKNFIETVSYSEKESATISLDKSKSGHHSGHSGQYHKVIDIRQKMGLLHLD